MDLRGHATWVTDVTFSHDGSLLASAGTDGAVILWNLETFQVDTTLRGHSSAVWDVAISPDGKKLASAGVDGKVRLWELPVPDEPDIEGMRVAYCPDGVNLVTTIESPNPVSNQLGMLTIRNATTLQKQASFFHPGRRYLATGSSKGSVRFWRAPRATSADVRAIPAVTSKRGSGRPIVLFQAH